MKIKRYTKFFANGQKRIVEGYDDCSHMYICKGLYSHEYTYYSEEKILECIEREKEDKYE